MGRLRPGYQDGGSGGQNLSAFQAESKIEITVCKDDQQIGKTGQGAVEEEEKNPDFDAEDWIGGGGCRGCAGSRLRMVCGFRFPGPSVRPSP